MKKSHIYKFLLPLVVAFFALLSVSLTDHKHVRVAKVIDGDTVELSNGKRARYIGIDTPEYRKKTEAGWRVEPEPFASQAKELNEVLVLGKEVRLEFDVQKEDKYGRLLVYCFVKKDGEGEIFVQAELLKKGLAYLYTFPPNVKYVDWFATALKEAKANKQGIWSVDLTIDSKDAARFIGERKMAQGVVKKSRLSDSLVRLTLDGLAVVIFKREMQLFRDQDIDPVDFYQGKKIRVFGLIKEYRAEPEIIVSNPWQIEVLE